MSKYFNLKKLVFISSIFITIVAEIYSIYGLSKLFSGHKISVIIMAIALAFGKIIVASLLKLQWKEIEIGRRIYLICALVVLSLITSLGIYGFLLDGYQTTKRKDDYVQTKIELVKKKKTYFEESSTQVKNELISVNNSIEGLRKSISTDNQTQQIIKGQVITNIVSSNKTGVQKQLDIALINKDKLDQRLLLLSDSIQVLDLKIIELEQSSDVASEIGPLKFVSSMSGLSMDRVINYFLLFFIFVFDPLALVLLWSYFSVKTSPTTPGQPEQENLVEETKTVDEVENIIQPIKKHRNVTKPLGRPRKNKKVEVNNLIDSIINEPKIEPPTIIDTNNNEVQKVETRPEPKQKRRLPVDRDLNKNVANKLDTATKKKV